MGICGAGGVEGMGIRGTSEGETCMVGEWIGISEGWLAGQDDGGASGVLVTTTQPILVQIVQIYVQYFNHQAGS